MKKKITSMLLALCMVLTLLCTTSCSFDDFDFDFGDFDFEEFFSSLFGDNGGNGGDDDDDGPGAEGREDFIDGIGGVSETFTGVVSVESFDSAKDAAEAYVAKEVVGESQAIVLGTNVVGELTDKEVKALNIPAEMQEGILGVEEISVSYRLNTPTAHALSTKAAKPTDTLNTEKTVRVYVIKYETNWKYFSPAPITGDTITRSYYDSVFNTQKYKNCTLSTQMNISIEISGMDNGTAVSQTMTMTSTQLIKHAGDKVYLEQRVTSGGMGEQTQTQTIYAYMETVDGRVVCYVKMGEDSTEWMPTILSTIGFSSLDELTPFYDQYLDYTYFTKTNYGFRLSEENARQYMTEALDALELGISGSEMDIDMFAEYYVSAGVLSGMRMDADIEFGMSQGGSSVSVTESVTSTVTCTDYGTTVVEKPFAE